MALAQAKKGGPYTKSEQRKRREEVYKLYFDYGYSARKIAEFLKINRNTIYNDISYLHITSLEKGHNVDPICYILNQFERFEIQRTRLRNKLNHVESFHEKITIEKFIFNIDMKIASFQLKFIETPINISKRIVYLINKEYEKMNGKIRNDSMYMFNDVSESAWEKIEKIYHEDFKLDTELDDVAK